MKSKACTLLMLLTALFTMPAKAHSPDHLMEKANQAYIEESYQEAILLYEQILDLEWESAYLYYNLGNTYFKEGNTGKAILNYEKALRISPNNEAIRHNLALAGQQIADRIEPLPQLFFLDWRDAFVRLQAVDGWAKTTIVCIVLLSISVGLFFVVRKKWQKKLGFAAALVLLLCTILGFYAAGRQYYNLHQKQEAIVMMPRLTAKSAPGERGIDLFLIHEGTKVEVTDSLWDWYEVRLANGNIGWVKSSGVEEI